jgi:hypothetical protein
MLNDTTTSSTRVIRVVDGVPNHVVNTGLRGPAARNATRRTA